MTEKMKQMEEKIRKIINKEQILKEKNEISVKEYKNNIVTNIINMPLSEEERITMIKDNMVNATVKYYCAYSLSDKAKVKILDYFTENEKLTLVETMKDSYKLKFLKDFDEKLKFSLAKILSDSSKLKVLDEFSKENKFKLVKTLDEKYKIKAIEKFENVDDKYAIALQLTDNYLAKVLDDFEGKKRIMLMSQIYNSNLREKLDIDNIIVNSLDQFSNTERRFLIRSLSMEAMEGTLQYLNKREKHSIACILPDDAKVRVADMFEKRERLSLLGRVKDKKLRKKYKIDEMIADNFSIFKNLEKKVMADNLSDEYVEKIIDYFDYEKETNEKIKQERKNEKINIAKRLSEKAKIDILKHFNEEDKLKIAKTLTDKGKEKVLNQFKELNKIALIASIEDEEIRNYAIEKSGVSNNPIIEVLFSDVDLDNIKQKNELIGLSKNITFGVELEVYGDKKVTEPLKYKTSYHNPKKVIFGYLLEPDSTIQRNDNEDGVEFVSPILKDNKNDIKGLEYICSKIKEMGLKTDYTCGGHIHFGTDFLENKPKAYENLFTIWNECEELLYKMSNPNGEKPRSTIEKFAKPGNLKTEKLYKNGEIKISGKDELENAIYNLRKRSVNERDSGLNIMNIGKKEKNTIEVRIPNGTIEIKELLNNIRLFGKIFEVSKKMTDNPEYKKDIFDKLKNKNVTEKRKLETLLELLFDKEQEKEIYRNRWDLVKEYNIFTELFKDNNTFKRGIYTMEEENER